VLASSQVELLRVHGGLALDAGKGCFNADGEAADKDSAACSYWSDGVANCTTTTKPYCYEVDISSVTPAGLPLTVVTYKVNVSWESLLSNKGNVALFYRVQNFPPGATPGGPGSPPASGSPAFSVNCADPIAAASGACAPSPGGPPPPSPPSYHYNKLFINVTTAIPDSEVASCVWDLGYPGAQLVNQYCYQGDSFYHTYPTVSPQAPYPGDCEGQPGANRVEYTARLTVTRTNGVVTSTSQVRPVPDCY
jgi:hypothetical protein